MSGIWGRAGRASLLPQVVKIMKETQRKAEPRHTKKDTWRERMVW
jgi:hypothetical protein